MRADQIERDMLTHPIREQVDKAPGRDVTRHVEFREASDAVAIDGPTSHDVTIFGDPIARHCNGVGLPIA